MVTFRRYKQTIVKWKETEITMGNGVSGKASANLKTIYVKVNGQKQKVSGIFPQQHLH